jgi:5-hydroxyisourate hydrolase
MSAKLTTHALDTMRGSGAAGLRVRVARLSPTPADLGAVVLDDGGRAVLAEGLEPGVYELVFEAGAYQRAHGLEDALFVDLIPVRFSVAEDLAHYHVPIILNPYGYSVYRGG